MKKIFSILLISLLNYFVVFSQTTVIPFQNYETICEFDTHQKNYFVINNLNEFKEISDCSIFNYDFSKYTIIGVQDHSPGHSMPNVDIIITQDNNLKNIIVEVLLSDVTPCYDGCRVVTPFYRRIIYTEKLNPTYPIEFKFTIVGN